MADKKISQLANGGAIQDTDLIPIARGGQNYSLSGSIFSKVKSVFGREGDVEAENGDYTASQIDFIPSGGINADNVKDAIIELDDNKANIKDAVFTDSAPVTQYYAATIGGSYTLDWRNGSKQRLTLGADVTIDIVPSSSFGIGASTKDTRFIVTFAQPSVGGPKFITTQAGIKSYVTNDDFWINQQLDSLLPNEEVTIEIWGDGDKGWCAKQLTAVIYEDEISSGSTIPLSSGVYLATVGFDLPPGKWRVSGTGGFVSGGGTVTGTIAEAFVSTSGSNNANGQNLSKNTFKTAGMPTTNGSANAIRTHYVDVPYGTSLQQILKFRGVFTVNTIRVYGGLSIELVI